MSGNSFLFEVQGLCKTFKKRMVVNHVNLNVKAGEIVGLLGKNGAGKSTTFKMIIGALPPDHGKVYFEGQEITNLPMYLRARKGIGYLAQETSLFKNLTVEENILAILETFKIAKKKRKQKTEEVLDKLGILHLKKQKAGPLSGGEKKRLEISRVISLEPRLILLDEPFAAVDPIARLEIKNIIKTLKNLNMGILITDHNERAILSSTERSYIMDNGQILTSGTTQEILKDPIALESYLGKDFSF